MTTVRHDQSNSWRDRNMRQTHKFSVTCDQMLDLVREAIINESEGVYDRESLCRLKFTNERVADFLLVADEDLSNIAPKD